jgi:transposase
MHGHTMARLTALSRERLIRRHFDGGEARKDLASQAGYCCAEADGYSLRTAYKWLARFRTGGLPRLSMRRCGLLAA